MFSYNYLSIPFTLASTETAGCSSRGLLQQAHWLLRAGIGSFSRHPPTQLPVCVLSNPGLIISFTHLNSYQWLMVFYLAEVHTGTYHQSLFSRPIGSVSGSRKQKRNLMCGQDWKSLTFTIKFKLSIYMQLSDLALTHFSVLLSAAPKLPTLLPKITK